MTGRMTVGPHRAAAPPRRLPIAALAAALLLGAPAALAAPVTLSVIPANGGAGVIASWRWLVNVDNTGVTRQRSPADGCSPASPGYPGTCLWTSIAGVPGSSPIAAQGNQDDFNGSLGTSIDLPPGRYLVSVLADGYKLDGVRFTVDATGAAVTVPLLANTLPDATIQAAVFEDVSPVNGAPDVPAERGLPGFQGHIADYLGEVTTDVYGAPLCGTGRCLSQCYVVANAVDVGTVAPVTGADGRARCPIDTTGLTTTQEGAAIPAGAVVEGKLKIPNLGPNRYSLSITPPTGSGWIQTTTLEGNLDWDAWVMEGATGLDTEFAVAGEPFPAVIFGYVPGPSLNRMAAGGTGRVKAVVDAVKVYVPSVGGIGGLPGNAGGLSGIKLDKPVPFPWVTLTDLTGGDTVVWIGRGDASGAVDIQGVPPGSYTLTWWDERLDYLLDLINVAVGPGEVVDLGILPLTGWWTRLEGFVFNDLNRNGVKDAGEPGIPNFTLSLRKRENSLMDRGTTLATTGPDGHYLFENGYPMTQWLVLEAYNDAFYTTGVTYQADNQPAPTTVMGAGVDVSVLPIIGLAGRIDWGVHAYDPSGRNCVATPTGPACPDPANGGIVGTVSYDTTRNELDPRYAAVEDWQPGVSGLVVDLWAPVDCGTHPGAPCDAAGWYELTPDGAYAKGQLLNTYVTETWQRPGLNGDGICIPRDVNGDRIAYPAGQQVTSNDADCLEGPLMGVQFQHGFSAVDGNYGFGDGCFAPNVLDRTDPAAPACRDAGGADVGFTTLPANDYLVEVEIPADAMGRPLYQVTREEDVNIARGDQFIPQVPPPPCAGPLHTVDLAGFGADGYPADTTFLPGVTVPASTPVVNDPFVGLGGTVYEGQPHPLCGTRLVTLAAGKSVVPTFNVFTDVPVPTRFWGLLVDDLNFSADPRSLLYGEKAGIPFAPVGIYDFTNRLVTTVESDFNGLFDVLLPSTDRISCPTPSGVCANVYRFVGNDPGTPGQLNPNYNPRFRTIAAEFEALPGLLVPTDLAPVQVGVSVQLPGGQANQAAQVTCALEAAQPRLFAVDTPYVRGSGAVTIDGLGFGAGQGAGAVLLGGTPLPVTSWSDTRIQATVPAGTAPGPYQLDVRAAGGLRTVNGLTFHVLGAGAAAVPELPALPVLDAFARANAANLGPRWAQLALLGTSALRVNGGQAFTPVPLLGMAYWNGPGAALGATQGAAVTLNGPAPSLNNAALVLKATGGSAAVPQRFLRVRYATAGGGRVFVETTVNAGLSYVRRGTFVAALAPGDRLTALADATGAVSAWRTRGGTTTLLGTAAIPLTGAGAWAPGAGGGRIGLHLLSPGARADDFAGGTTVAPAAAAAGYDPLVYEVGPGRTYDPGPTFDPAAPPHAIQRALDAAAAAASPRGALVVVYPGTPQGDRINPLGAYYENVIMHSPVKLQGVGPGGFQGTTWVRGSVLDGSAFGGDGQLETDWRAKVASLTWVGNQTVQEGEVVYVLARTATQFTEDFEAAVDGFSIRGGNQQGFPANINEIGGGPTGLPAAVITQGGAIFANAYAHFLQVTNDEIEANGGSYGAVRIGTPNLTPASSFNDHVRIARNRIVHNAGTNLAGAIGLFAGADAYEVSGNDLCGNFSAEYGGAISAYGYSPGGRILRNRIWFNQSYDEGGAVFVAGELPADPAALSPGSGPVEIAGNLIQANLSNDDGGGLRLLMVGNVPVSVHDNFIVNNVATHEGGGVALDDAPDVRFFGNTVMKNLTTATAVASNGLPMPAGLSTALNSAPLQATLPPGAPPFSAPLLFDNVFWDNRAGTRSGGTVLGLGLVGDTAPVTSWDMGVSDAAGVLSASGSVLQDGTGVAADPSNVVGVDPGVVATYDLSVAFAPWRTNPAFVGAVMVAVDLPPTLMGDYHLAAGSPAIDLGVPSRGGVPMSTTDIDGQARPAGGAPDAGADEVAP